MELKPLNILMARGRLPSSTVARLVLEYLKDLVELKLRVFTVLNSLQVYSPRQ